MRHHLGLLAILNVQKPKSHKQENSEPHPADQMIQPAVGAGTKLLARLVKKKKKKSQGLVTLSSVERRSKLYLYIFKDMYFFQQIFDCKKKKFRDMTRKDESGAKAREMWRDFFLSAFAGSWGIKVCINRMS